MEENEIVVCIHCGNNGDETIIEEYGKHSGTIDKYGYTRNSDLDIESYYCCECSCETDMISIKDWLALNRDKQIDEILKD